MNFPPEKSHTPFLPISNRVFEALRFTFPFLHISRRKCIRLGHSFKEGGLRKNNERRKCESTGHQPGEYGENYLQNLHARTVVFF